jgi:hypothetical protein
LDIVFQDKSINGTVRPIKLSEVMSHQHPKYIHLHTLSEDYYKYLYSINHKPDNAFVDPVSIHSNIENGIGIFAAYNEVVDSVLNTQ